ncbi:MAG: peptidylprolyl isomerase [Ginsengibacter sp.]
MKQLILLATFLLAITMAQSQVLFSYGNHPVSKEEFLKAYNKNKTATNTKEDLQDYLDLFIKFKLKVQAAEDLHLDTLPSLKADLQNFRSQIEEGYLKDNEQVAALTREAYQRSKKDIHTLHFYIAINNKMLPVDTLKAYKAINEVYDELKEGKTNYEEILEKVKREIAPVQGNDLGFVTVFTLPYEYENIVYDLHPGETSKPMRSTKGWHIFKNKEERPAVGKITVAQILFAVPAGNNFLKEQAKHHADSVYKALKSGADFSEMAKTYSNDKMTYMNGGILPEFGVAKFDGGFESAAFSLKKDGDISEPFQTEYGYHILKRISGSPVPVNNPDEDFMENLRQQVLNDSRIETAKEKFVKEILAKISFRKNPLVSEATLWKIKDSSFTANKKITEGNISAKTILFSFDNEKRTIGDWLEYLKSTGQATVNQQQPRNAEQLHNYITTAATENYRKRLESFNTDFKYQLKEFKEGNMLFEIMERKVWAKASADSAGLLKYYLAHKNKYTWDASADAILYSSANAEIASRIMKQVKEEKTWHEIMKENPTQVQADSGRFELSQIPVVDRTNFRAGLVTQPVTNEGDGTTVFSQLIRVYPENQQRKFEDARGLVINDYQVLLENKWIDQLKKKYPVKVNESVLKSL